MTPKFRTTNPIDYDISLLVGLETYKALYANWPSLYSYISDPLFPTNYFNSLVLGVVASSGLNFNEAGDKIKSILTSIVKNSQNSKELKNFEISEELKNFENSEEKNFQNDLVMIKPLINSSYPVKNLNYTPWENFLWISITIFLAVFILFYFYYIGGVNYIFGNDGIACYVCPSIFDKFDL